MLLKRSLVSLDHLIDLNQYHQTKKRRLPIDIIDEMLASNKSPTINKSPIAKRKVKKPARFSPQKTVFVRDPSGYCPKCRVFVKGEGVVCEKCEAYWHYQCAGVSQEEVDRDWKEIEFICDLHRDQEKALTMSDICESIPGVSVNGIKGQSTKNIDEILTNIKVHTYKLNVKAKLKDKLDNLVNPLAIEENDGGRQYSLKLNSVTYQFEKKTLVRCIKYGILIN